MNDTGTTHPTPAEEVLEPISADLRSLLDVANGGPMSLGEKPLWALLDPGWSRY